MSLFSHDGKLIGTYQKISIKRGEDHPRTFYVQYEGFKPAMKNIEIDDYTVGKDIVDTGSIAIPISQLGKKITSDFIDEIWVDGLHGCNPIGMDDFKEIVKKKDKITPRELRTWLKENDLGSEYDLRHNDLRKATRFINSLKGHIELK